MRFVRLIPAALVVSFAGAAFGQAEWAEFVDRADHFTVNMPGDPKKEDLAYKTAKGTTLPAHLYSAEDRRGQYYMTVVNYQTASADELASAIEEASAAVRAKGKATYDAPGNLDGHKSQRITIETPTGRRHLAEILVSKDKRLYISEAETALNAPPPAQYQASIQVLDDNGVRIRYQNGVQVGQPAQPAPPVR
jgi:flavin reductase (DIM6/NTAB) family NADH-FMN oxidoreductase RutF